MKRIICFLLPLLILAVLATGCHSTKSQIKYQGTVFIKETENGVELGCEVQANKHCSSLSVLNFMDLTKEVENLLKELSDNNSEMIVNDNNIEKAKYTWDFSNCSEDFHPIIKAAETVSFANTTLSENSEQIIAIINRYNIKIRFVSEDFDYIEQSELLVVSNN